MVSFTGSMTFCSVSALPPDVYMYFEKCVGDSIAWKSAVSGILIKLDLRLSQKSDRHSFVSSVCGPKPEAAYFVYNSCTDSTALAFLTVAYVENLTNNLQLTLTIRIHEYMITQFPLIGVSVDAATRYAFLHNMLICFIEQAE